MYGFHECTCCSDMKAKAKKRPTKCSIPSSFQPMILSLNTPKHLKVRCTMNTKLTTQGTATWAHDFQMAPDSGHPTRLGAQRLPPHLEATAPPEMATSRETRRRVVRRDTSLHRSSRRGRTLTRPALPPHARHELFPQQSIHHGYFQAGPWARHLWALRFYPRRRDPPSAAPVPATAVPPAATTPGFRSGLGGGSAGLGAAAPAR